MKANRLVLFAVTGAALLALTGCSQSPTSAATVGGVDIPTSDVTFLARMQCLSLDAAAKNPQQGQPPTLTRTSQVRADMVNALVQSQLNQQLAAKTKAGYDQQAFRTLMNQFESAVQLAPEKDRSRFRDLVGSFYRGQLQVYSLAAQVLAAQGVVKPSNDEVSNEVATLQGAFRGSVKISVNPEFGPDASGVAGQADPSLSAALSAFAKQAVSNTPTADWLSALPSNQRCG